MKRKLPIILVASSAIMLAASTIGSTKATLTYMSDNYLAQIDIKSIGVTLTENGNDVSWRDYKHKDDDWSEATGVLLGDMLKNAGDEKLILDKKYDEKLAVKNSGSIDEYVRVTVQHYWADKETGDKLSNLDPSNIQIDFTNDGWTEDKSAETTERNVFYYNSILKKGQTSTDFTDKISISGDIAAIVGQTSQTDDNGLTTITTTYEYDGAQFVLEATVDAVQTHNAKDAIKSAWGVDVNISDDGALSFSAVYWLRRRGAFGLGRCFSGVRGTLHTG